MDARSSILVVGFLYFSAHLCRGFPTSDSAESDRIINGTYTNIEVVPYQLSFMLDGKYACGAAIISTNWALTAAHCVRAGLGSEITVRSGSSFPYEHGTVHRVIDFLIHEYYDPRTNDYDIALMKVSSPFIYDDCTKPVRLPPLDGQTISNELCLDCGWGYYKKLLNTFVIQEMSDKLQCIQLPLIKKSECIQDYEGAFTLTPRMECYGFENGQGDSCQGDSGSPLVNKDNIVLGITSLGRGCAQKHSPGVYTNVTALRGWIWDNIGI
ncbi:hypothetical protein DMN91_008804 [Ooceraea biroi]|uniref:trypsin n=1 Tax=Ooceraea biroi TaxID=2015173 RepID=A0A026WA00_OOCBI|nr:trypsin-1 [Ooceraea biroi]EZA52798.1 Trypsin-1 [Ooceraea biroi]RLU18447.1 hypothetical protein DMN91_008804 [Ooceraea biroi]